MEEERRHPGRLFPAGSLGAGYVKDLRAPLPDVPLLCTVRQPYGAESFDWIDAIIDNTMRIENGYAYPRAGAGWGFNFKPEALTEVK